MNEEYLNVKGRIFDIQKYSIHDGPGIRTIVFLKGCAFRCRWCCNPESQNYEIEKMIFGGKEKIVGRDVTVGEVLEEVLKDMPYYRRTGGGITLSGGESLLQPEFSSALCRGAKEYGITTAIETTGFAPFEKIEKVLEYMDYVLMDIKHMNDEKHKNFCGQSNKLVLENARKIKNSGVELIIRVPVIPTFNDNKEDISQIARFAKGLGVSKLHLLPYHRMGEDKYAGLGRDYMLKGIKPLEDDYMNELFDEAFKIFGEGCQIGG